MRDMRGLGIDTAICGSAANWGRPVFGGYEKTVGLPLKLGCEDPLGVCVDEAEKLGMKMFFGVGFRGRVSQVRDYAKMEPPWPKVWFTWNTALAEALMERFGGRKCFAGLYIAYEVDFQEHQVELYEKLMKEHLRPAVGKGVKLLASPGMYQMEREEVERLPGQLERMGIDILAPQDCGGRENGLERVQKNVAVLEAIRGPLEGIGVELWCNIETFGREMGPDGRPRCIAGPMERIEKQIAMQEKLVKKLICYQYQGIMNRRTKLVNIGHASTEKLYADYAAYLRRWKNSKSWFSSKKVGEK